MSCVVENILHLLLTEQLICACFGHFLCGSATRSIRTFAQSMQKQESALLLVPVSSIIQRRRSNTLHVRRTKKSLASENAAILLRKILLVTKFKEIAQARSWLNQVMKLQSL